MPVEALPVAAVEHGAGGDDGDPGQPRQAGREVEVRRVEARRVGRAVRDGDDRLAERARRGDLEQPPPQAVLVERAGGRGAGREGAERRREKAGLVQEAPRPAVDVRARLQVRDRQPLEGVDGAPVAREVVVEREQQPHEARPQAERRRGAAALGVARGGAGERLALHFGEEARRALRQARVEVPIPLRASDEADTRAPGRRPRLRPARRLHRRSGRRPRLRPARRLHRRSGRRPRLRPARPPRRRSGRRPRLRPARRPRRRSGRRPRFHPARRLQRRSGADPHSLPCSHRRERAAQVPGGAARRNQHDAVPAGRRYRAGDGVLKGRERGDPQEAISSRRDHEPIVTGLSRVGRWKAGSSHPDPARCRHPGGKPSRRS